MNQDNSIKSPEKNEMNQDESIESPEKNEMKAAVEKYNIRYRTGRQDQKISVKMFGIVGRRLYLSKYPDSNQFFGQIHSGEFVEFSELIEPTLNWLKSQGEFKSSSGLPVDEVDVLAHIAQFDWGLQKISLDEFLQLHPKLSKNPRSFISFVLKSGSKSKENSGDLWEMDNIEKLYEDWKQRPKWYHVSTWWKILKEKLSNSWQRIFGFLRGTTKKASK
ncbi:hypothetical protein PTTG_25352 [Puccinia triticina 1-1 BBBD Race 1]|uniref:Uncharacterized protein n=1 Tax=Puccinia triticina (isolate 1-1 / race 1 (BBBD)) TaxID=630390 RepID=A0A180H490_PUCT1|nr:hypothetical protein PTTG_25352 [Puccinia triticina 1-1 BBBD Race 1]WAR57571.1 hypothetical protein PtB15_8B623 [Puccinia triticina]